jgi:Holliday junction resolvasome RuvABC endonuclease subunit
MSDVLGLDLSLTATGLAAPDGSTSTIKTRDKDGDRRLAQIRDTIAGLCGGVDLAVIEDLPTHASSAGISGLVHGAVRAALLDAGVPYALVTPATLKKYATGNGSAKKSGMILAAYKRFGVEFDDEDQCDAAWLRAAGLDQLGEPLAVLPAAQRQVLAKVRWPDLAVARAIA